MATLHPSRACDICLTRPATYTLREGEQQLCEADAMYMVGGEHVRAQAARDDLTAAVGELVDCGVDGDRIRELVAATLDGRMPPPIAPAGGDHRAPRPWAVLLAPIDGAAT